MKILLVEDEVQLCESLKELLKGEKWTVEYVHDGLTAVDYIMCGGYDIVVLDIMLPGLSGIEVLSEIRNRGNTVPVLLLSAKRSSGDKVTGLDTGADDYLTKPFDPTELKARLRALYRRKQDTYKTETIELANISLDAATATLQTSRKTIQLTAKESDLVELFLYNPGHVFDKEAIITKLWPLDSDVTYNNVEAHISSIRRKMKKIGSQARIITIRGIGYKLEG